MRIIAYTYEADYHCIDCTRQQYLQNTIYLPGSPIYGRRSEKDEAKRDDHAILYDQEDNEGNLVHPLFSTDEWQELDESYLAENPTQYLACGDCHETIDEYTVESEVTA